MYWRKIILIFISSFLLANNIKDEIILDAILNENKNSEISSKAYQKLYEMTKLKSYLEDAIKQGFIANIKNDYLIKELEKIDENSDLLTKIKIIDLLEKKDYKNAIFHYKKYINNNEDFSLASVFYKQLLAEGLTKESFKIAEFYYKKYDNPYSFYMYLEALFNEGKYKKIINLTDKIYKSAEQNYKAEDIQIPYLAMRLKALQALKDYKNMFYLDPQSVLKHIEKLDKDKDYKKILELTKNLELNEENIYFLIFRAKAISELNIKSKMDELIKISLILYNKFNNPSVLYALANFLKEDKKRLLELAKIDDELAIVIYSDFLKDYEKLSEKLYSKAIKTGDNALLADSYVFEMMANPHKFDYFKIDELIAKGGVHPNTINSYAYTLIEEKIDIKKGIRLVKIALKEDSENGYFLDTLAWGYYLLNDCENALKYIKQALKDKKALKEEDVLKHFEKIKKCKK